MNTNNGSKKHGFKLFGIALLLLWLSDQLVDLEGEGVRGQLKDDIITFI